MAETLGSLCDKLTIVKLKQFHSDDPVRLKDLDIQAEQLQKEMDAFINGAVAGDIPLEKLSFAANKVFKQEGNEAPDVSGTIGEVVSRLATVNCRLWHQQEHVYEFEKVPADQKDVIVKNLAVLNLERNNCIDQIDRTFKAAVSSGNSRLYGQNGGNKCI